MNFCSVCGHKVELQIPEGDDRERYVCSNCGAIHYQNPNIIAGCIPVYEDRVLLCRRAIEPRRGLWTLPAGFMENGETTQQAAMRETWEEALARVDINNVYTMFNLPHINQFYMFFLAALPEPEFAPGTESLEVALFAEHEIPWDDLAFNVVIRTLRHFFSDRETGDYPIRILDIDHNPNWRAQS